MSRWIPIYALLGGLAFVLSALLTWLLIRVAPRFGLIDRPAVHKFHSRPTPVGGGLAICLSLLPLAVLPATQSPRTTLVLGASFFLALVGLIDDVRHISAVTKFLVLLVMTGLLAWFGVGANPTHIAALDLVITMLWVTGVSSAFNAIDNMDGLATGVSAIAACCFLIIALETAQWQLGALSAALLGGTLGFLPFNFSPARVFMGDTGSFFLGFFLATLGIVGDWNDNEVIAAVIPILILGLPIFDLTFTVLRRHLTGITRTPLEALQHCGTDHLSHRLVRIGLSPRQSVLLLYLIAASFGISAVTLRNARSADGVLHLLQAVIVTAALIPILRLAESLPGAPPAGSDDASGTTGKR